MIDAATGGAVMSKTPEDGMQLIRDMAQNHHRWGTERATSSTSGMRQYPSQYAALSAQVNSLTQKLNSMQFAPHLIVPGSCDYCGTPGHGAEECRLLTSTADYEGDQVNAVGGFPRKPYDPNNPTYRPEWRNHPVFSYGNNASAGGAPQGFRPPANHPAPPQKSRLEVMMEGLIADSAKRHGEVIDTLNRHAVRIDSLEAHAKLVDSQIAQLAGSVARPLGTLPGQPVANPREHLHAVVTRSGRSLGDQRRVGVEVLRRKEPKETHQDEEEREEEEEKEEAEEEFRKKGDSSIEEPPAQQPPIPFPQRQAQPKTEGQYNKFLEVMRKLQMNIPFTDAITQMPVYRKFLKEILSNKRKLEAAGEVPLTAHCSAIVQNVRPEKLKDPGSFSIPCHVGNIFVSGALCDSGASVSLMPLSLCRNLDLGDPKPTNITLQLADRSVKRPVGVLEDVPVRVGDLFVPVDFVVIDITDDRLAVILGRPFLATAGAKIDWKSGTLAFRVGNEEIEFCLPGFPREGTNEKSCYVLEMNDDQEHLCAAERVSNHLSRETRGRQLIHHVPHIDFGPRMSWAKLFKIKLYEPP